MKNILFYLFIIYFVLMGIFSSEFAKFSIINVGLPILPTELLIFVFIIYFVFNPSDRYPHSQLFIGYIFFITILLLLTIEISPFVIRIIVPFFYIILAYITYDVVRYRLNIDLIEKLNKIIVISAFILTLFNAISGGGTTQNETSTQGVYYLYQGAFGVFFLQFYFSLNNILNKNYKYEFFYVVLVIIWVLFFALHRSAIIAFFLPTILVFHREIRNKFGLVLSVFAIGMLFIFSAFAFLNIGSESSGIINRLLSIFQSEDDPNARWRIMMWNAAIGEFLSSPLHILFGSGFKFFAFELTQDLGNDLTKAPFQGFHNSLLFILFRTGIVGFGLIFYFFFNPIRRAMKSRNINVKPFLGGLLAMIIFSFFNVVFENPYGGFYLWFNVGVTYALLEENINKIGTESNEVKNSSSR